MTVNPYRADADRLFLSSMSSPKACAMWQDAHAKAEQWDTDHSYAGAHYIGCAGGHVWKSSSGHYFVGKDPEMIPVPVCEFCAAGNVADDDVASVAVAIAGNGNGKGSVEYVCQEHAALLFPESWRTLSRIDPAWLDTSDTGTKYEVGNYGVWFQFLPVP
jgi:hypothetical protein